MKYFTGIDVSKKKLDIAWLRDAATGKKKNKKLDNTALGHAMVAKWLTDSTKGKPEEIVVVLEPTGVYHESLALFLQQSGFHVVLANPGKAKKYAESRGQTHKTDKQDGLMLARYGEANLDMLSPWQPEPSEARELKVLLRRLNALEKDLQREYNRQEATEFSLSSDEVKKSLQQMIEALKAEIKRLTDDIDNHIDKHPQLKKNRQLLQSVKGVGAVISREMLCLLACKTFKDARQVSAFLGLIPKHRESGNLAGRTLVQICFGVIKHQSEYQPQLEIRA